MGQLFKRPKNPPNGPRFPETPMLDSVDWSHKILYGSETQRLIAIFEAKTRKAVEALPGLLIASLKNDEGASEAKVAAIVIIEDNKGHKSILDLVPELVKKLPDPRVLWIFSTIAEANPKADECCKAVPVLVKLLVELKNGEDEPLRDILFALGKIGDSSAAGPINSFIQSGRAQEGSDLWITAMGTLRRLEPQ